jgi:hypothetical protein
MREEVICEEMQKGRDFGCEFLVLDLRVCRRMMLGEGF